MKQIIQKPYIFFFGLSIITFIASFFFANKTIEIAFYDTYFVILYKNFCQFSSVFYLMIAVNYFALKWTQKPPIKWLTKTHIILQLISLLLLATKSNWNWIGSSSKIIINTTNDNTVIFLSILVFTLSLFIHFTNFFASLLLKRD